MFAVKTDSHVDGYRINGGGHFARLFVAGEKLERRPSVDKRRHPVVVVPVGHHRGGGREYHGQSGDNRQRRFGHHLGGGGGKRVVRLGGV